MRRHAVTLAMVLLLLVGFALLGQGLWIHAKAGLAQMLLDRAWETAKAEGGRPRPWPWADSWPVARLRVERLGVDLVVLAGASGSSLAFGPGHLGGTVAPGAEGLSILGGHRDTHFRFLRELRPGDRVTSQRPGAAPVAWTVRVTQVVERPQVFPPAIDGPLLALVTCYPFDDPVPGGPARMLAWLTPERVAPAGSDPISEAFPEQARSSQ